MKLSLCAALFLMIGSALRINATSPQENQDDLSSDMRLAPYGFTFTSHNVWLRPVFPMDTKAFFPIYTNPHVMKYFGSGQTFKEEQIAAMVPLWAQCSLEFPSKGYHRWSILTKDGVVGYVAFSDSSEPDKRWEIAYCINPSYQGRGYATEASHLLLHHFQASFVATAHPLNISSWKVLEKLGFKKDKTRENVAKFGQVRDYYLLEKNTDED